MQLERGCLFLGFPGRVLEVTHTWLWAGVCWGSGQQGSFLWYSCRPWRGQWCCPQPGCLAFAAALLYCGGVCGGKGLFMNIFFSTIFFLPDLLAPSCKGSWRCSGEEEQEKSKLRGSETQVSAELKQSFLALLLSSLLLAWPWVGVGGKDLLTCLKQLYKLAF